MKITLTTMNNEFIIYYCGFIQFNLIKQQLAKQQQQTKKVII